MAAVRMRNRTIVGLVTGLAIVCLALSLLFIGLSFAAPIPDSWGFRGFGFINAVGFSTIGVIVVATGT